MTDLREKLLPCPFCGNDGSGPIEDALQISHSQLDWHPSYDVYFVQCDRCTANMGYSPSEAEAIAAWNTRAPVAAPTDPAPDELEALRSEVFEVLRRHDVSEQCFAEVAMVTQAAIIYPPIAAPTGDALGALMAARDVLNDALMPDGIYAEQAEPALVKINAAIAALTGKATT